MLYLTARAQKASPSMDDRTTETALSLTKFGVGQPVRRSEDPTLVRGQGRYTDDVSRPNQAYAVMICFSAFFGVAIGLGTWLPNIMPLAKRRGDEVAPLPVSAPPSSSQMKARPEPLCSPNARIAPVPWV